MPKENNRFILDLDAPCPCGSPKLLRDCCGKWGTPRKRIPSLVPPGPPSGYAHPRCYFRNTRNCSTKVTGEHVVSRTVLASIGTTIRVGGAVWLPPGETRDIRVQNLTSNILCDRHN